MSLLTGSLIAACDGLPWRMGNHLVLEILAPPEPEFEPNLGGALFRSPETPVPLNLEFSGSLSLQKVGRILGEP